MDIAIWLDAIKRFVCRDCRILVPWARKCKGCDRRVTRSWGAALEPQPACRTPAEDPVPDEVWRQLVSQSMPVLRHIPAGCQEAFFSQLGVELDLLDRSATDTQVYRLAPFCRIVLQPVG